MAAHSHDDDRPDEFSGLEEALGYRFREIALLRLALTHRSFVHEREGENLQHNESLEFLGDSVLGFLVSDRIFRLFPNRAEGELSKTKAHLVSAENLVRLAESVRLGDYLRLGRGEEKTGGRKKRAILADALEALLAAVYLDGGIQAANDVTGRLLAPCLEELDPEQPFFGDFKSALQEQLHDLGRPAPAYQVVNEIGPDHRKTFVVQVVIGDRVAAEAAGSSKKEAQQQAARLALEALRSE
jgi:ribonuclease III